jgi:hypothetical protein
MSYIFLGSCNPTILGGGFCNNVSGYSTIIGGYTGNVPNTSSGYWSKDNYHINKNYLAEVFMKKMGITDEDLNKDPSWIKAKIRDNIIDSIIG